MAIYHLTAKTISRGTSSAKARHDYIEREGRYASDKSEVVYSQSGNMPEWTTDSKKYWEATDTYERGNGRLFKQLEFALPKELTADQQKALVQSYVDKLTSTKDGPLPYSFAIHKGHDKENPHCHLMISERALDGHQRSPETWFKRANSKRPELGGAKKSEALKPKEWLQEARKEWSLQANLALERTGHKTRIDHRTLDAQGIDRKPTKHLGPAAAAMERKGITTRRGQVIAQGDDTDRNNQAIQSQLEEVKAQQAAINDGMSQARERFQAEKEQRRQEAERQRQAEQQRREAAEQQHREATERQRLEQEREALRKQKELEHKQEQEKQARLKEQEERKQQPRHRGGMSL